MNIIVNGAAGRMGQQVCRLVEAEGHTLAAAVDRSGKDFEVPDGDNWMIWKNLPKKVTEAFGHTFIDWKSTTAAEWEELMASYLHCVEKLGFTAHAPQYTEVYDLIEDKIVAPGYLPERRTRAYEGAPKAAPAYQKLVQMGDMLIGLIRRSKGRDNKSLAAFAEAISKIINKFEF